MRLKIHLILCFFAIQLTGQNRVPAEWEQQNAVWLQWPLQFEHWMRPEMASTIAAIQDYEPVHLIVQNDSQLQQA